MAVTLILSIGLDRDLMVSRSLVLQSAGYLVVTAYSIKEAVDRFQEGDFDLVLLCQSVPTNDRDRLTAWIRASGSRVPIVSVSPRLYQGDAFAGVTVGSEPAALPRDIREALTNAALPASRTTTSLRRKETTGSLMIRRPILGTGDQQQIETATRRLLPLPAQIESVLACSLYSGLNIGRQFTREPLEGGPQLCPRNPRPLKPGEREIMMLPQPYVFVVDDEELIASTLEMILQQAGLHARSFTKPLEALQAARVEAPDLLLSDVVMPLLSGVELAIQLRRFCPDCKVLLLSGNAATPHVLEAARANGYDFELLTKPVHPADLLAKIRNSTESISTQPTF